MRESNETKARKRLLRLTREIRLGRMLANNVAMLSSQIARIERRYPGLAIEGI